MLNQIPEGVVWAIFLLPFGSFAVISLAALLGLTYHQFRGLYRKHRDQLATS